MQVEDRLCVRLWVYRVGRMIDLSVAFGLGLPRVIEPTSGLQKPLIQRVGRRRGIFILYPLPALPEILTPIPQQLGKSPLLAVLPLILIPQNTQMHARRQMLPMRDLLHRTPCQQAPRQCIRLLVLLALRIGIQTHGEEIEHFLPGAREAEEVLAAPVLGQDVPDQDVLLPVLGADEAIAFVFREHADSHPADDLHDVFEHCQRVDFEVPVVLLRAGVVETQRLRERHQRIRGEALGVRPVAPEVHEEVVPALDEGVAFAGGDEVVRHRDAVHPGRGDLVGRVGVLELGPADAVERADEEVADIHKGTAVTE